MLYSSTTSVLFQHNKSRTIFNIYYKSMPTDVLNIYITREKLKEKE